MFHLDTTETGLELSVCRPCTWSALSSTLSLHELGKCEWTVLTEKNTVQLNEMIAKNWLVNGKMS